MTMGTEKMVKLYVLHKKCKKNRQKNENIT